MQNGDILITISNLLLAIATFFSAFIAIRISTANTKAKYKINFIIGQIYPKNSKEIFYTIFLINESLNIPITIDFVGIRNLSKNKSLIINPPYDKFPFTNLPVKLLYGDQYTFVIGKEMAKSILEKVSKNTKKLSFVFIDKIGREYKHIIKLADLKSIME
jgi:hypothetical protein